MTIQLKDPIFIAGVHQAAGVSLTLGADVEAELVNRGVAVYTSGPVVIRKDSTLVFDEQGNLIANVTPRTGTLTNLLTTVAGGVGEVSYATDWDAAVVHNGVAGGARVLYCKPKRCAAKIDTFSVANAAQTKVVLDTVIEDPHSLFDAVNGIINIPSDATHYRAFIAGAFAANATGRRSVKLGANNGTTAPTGLPAPIVSQPVCSASDVPALATQLPATEIATETSLTLVVLQNSGGALNVSTGPTGGTMLAVEFWRES